LRLRLVDAAGEPIRNQWMTVSSQNQKVRTDERGEMEVGGFAPGPQSPIHVALQTDPEFTVAILRGVTLPATLDVTLQRVGAVPVELLVGDAGLSKDVGIRLLAADGHAVDETVFKAAKTKPRPKIGWWPRVTDAGTYRVEVTVGDVVRTATVEAAPGTRSPTVSFDLR
jgi:hypothetical protein